MNAARIALRGVTAAAIALAGWWAFRPLEKPDLALPQPPAGGSDIPADTVALAALDDSAFRVPLWVTPPPPPVEAKPIPLPPLKLQLLAIVRQANPSEGGDDSPHGTEYKALLYDPDTDKIIEVAAGQSIGDRTVVGITHRELTLKDRAGTRTLSLRTDASGGGGGS